MAGSLLRVRPSGPAHRTPGIDSTIIIDFSFEKEEQAEDVGDPRAWWAFPSPVGTQTMRAWRMFGLSLLLLALGILLRLAFFLSRPPLWGDEAMMAVNFALDPLSWLHGLRFNQTAPFGYLLLSAGAVRIFGDGVLALRSIPFLAGIASLILFQVLARRVLGGPWSILAVGLLALSAPAIYYSGEVKPYSLDVLVATGLLLVAYPGELSRERAVWAAVAAGASLLHTYPFSPLRDGPRMGRLFLFALPGLILLVALGLKGMGRAGPVVALTLTVLVGVRGIRAATDPQAVFYRPDITRAIALIRTQQDTVVVPPHIVPLFRYYSEREGLRVTLRPAVAVDGNTFQRAWFYTDRSSRMGEEAFLERYCRNRCRVIRLGSQLLLRVERDAS